MSDNTETKTVRGYSLTVAQREHVTKQALKRTAQTGRRVSDSEYLGTLIDKDINEHKVIKIIKKEPIS